MEEGLRLGDLENPLEVHAEVAQWRRAVAPAGDSEPAIEHAAVEYPEPGTLGLAVEPFPLRLLAVDANALPALLRFATRPRLKDAADGWVGAKTEAEALAGGEPEPQWLVVGGQQNAVRPQVSPVGLVL